MVFLLVSEKWTPMGQSQYRLEKWEPEESLSYGVDDGFNSNGDWRWRVPPYYRLFKVDGTELIDTTDWNHIVGFLQAVLGDEVIPSDFEM